MIFLRLFVAAAIVAVILYLPYLSGLTTIERSEGHKKSSKKTNKEQSQNFSFGGYVPPEERNSYDADSESSTSALRARASALKEKVSITADDLPVKIALLDHQKLTHRKKEKLDLDSNPNNYDYDLDEFIAEETQKAAENQRREFYEKENVGGEKEEMV